MDEDQEDEENWQDLNEIQTADVEISKDLARILNLRIEHGGKNNRKTLTQLSQTIYPTTPAYCPAFKTTTGRSKKNRIKCSISSLCVGSGYEWWSVCASKNPLKWSIDGFAGGRITEAFIRTPEFIAAAKAFLKMIKDNQNERTGDAKWIAAVEAAKKRAQEIKEKKKLAALKLKSSSRLQIETVGEGVTEQDETLADNVTNLSTPPPSSAGHYSDSERVETTIESSIQSIANTPSLNSAVSCARSKSAPSNDASTYLSKSANLQSIKFSSQSDQLSRQGKAMSSQSSAIPLRHTPISSAAPTQVIRNPSVSSASAVNYSISKKPVAPRIEPSQWVIEVSENGVTSDKIFSVFDPRGLGRSMTVVTEDKKQRTMTFNSVKVTGVRTACWPAFND